MEKETWKKEILESLEGIQRATPPPDLYEKIRITAMATQMQVVKRPYAALVAACLLALIAANIWSLSGTGRLKPAEAPFSATYQVDNANFYLY